MVAICGGKMSWDIFWIRSVIGPFTSSILLPGPEMEECIVWDAEWSFVPVTLSPAPSRRRTSGRSNVRLSMAGTSTSTVYLLMSAGCPSTAEVRILFFSSHNRHNVTLILTAIGVNCLSLSCLLCQSWWRTGVSCSAGWPAAQLTISSGTGSLMARHADPIPTTSVSRACAGWGS